MSLALSLIIQIALGILQAIVASHPELKTNAFVAAILADLASLHATAKSG